MFKVSFLNKDYSKKVFQFIFLSSLIIFFYNFFHYTPMLGYDASAHFSYIDSFSKYLPRKFILPTKLDSREFFSPPIPYLVPSFIQVLCRNFIESSNYLYDCKPVYSKVSQLFNYIIYFLVIFINLASLKKILKTSNIYYASYLLLISMIAVNYRTFSMIRGEPYIVLFMSIGIYLFILLIDNNYNFDFRNVLHFGFIIALLALSRQWAFLLFPPFFIIYLTKVVNRNKNYLKFILFSFLIGFVFSGWFYFMLYFEYGSFISFNLESLGFSFKNKPFTFYIPSLSYIIQLFSNPIRPYLSNQFITSFYADVWTDYWGYFSFTSQYLNIGRNQLNIGNYFAKVNVLSVVTTFLIIHFWRNANIFFKTHPIIKLINYTIFVNVIGFLWFVISYPEPAGDTVKAAYMIQILYLIVFISSLGLEKLKRDNLYSYNLILIILIAIYIFNYQTYLSHFPRNFLNNLNI